MGRAPGQEGAPRNKVFVGPAGSAPAPTPVYRSLVKQTQQRHLYWTSPWLQNQGKKEKGIKQGKFKRHEHRGEGGMNEKRQKEGKMDGWMEGRKEGMEGGRESKKEEMKEWREGMGRKDREVGR